MSLQLIFGGSGSGKSDFVYQKILEQSKSEPERTFFVLVPEQFTMQTQRELVARQEHHSIMNVDVVSFNRLAYRIFDELGMSHLNILEETGKNLVLRRVAEEQQNNLRLLKASMKKTGYISEVKSIISELTQYRIAPSQLDVLIDQENQSPLFRYKIQDIQTMYQGFQDYLQGRFITAEELLEVFSQVASQSELLKHSVLVLDGFTGFTPIQYHLLEVLLKLTKEILVTVTLDSREDPYNSRGIQELFYMSKKTVETLTAIAARQHVMIEEPIWVQHSDRSRFAQSPSLLWLEQNLFRQKPAVYHRQKKESTQSKAEENSISYAVQAKENSAQLDAYQDIFLYSLPNPRQELHFIARKIKELVQKQGYRYKDIAIVCGDVKLYGNYAEEIFATYEIPLFLDTTRDILFHPMTEFLKRALLVVEQDFSYEAVLGYLRCGLSGFLMEEIDLLENYLLAENIRGYRRWQKKWVRRGKIHNQQELELINELREKLIGQFTPLREIFRSQEHATVLQESRVFYQLIYALGVEDQLKEYETRFQQEGESALAREYAQIYKVAMDLMDKMVELLGEEQLSIREYREILEAGMEAAAIGIIPPGYDRVVFGDIERTRLSEIKVLFFAGVNDGLIPKAVEHGGIISQAERELFASYQMELAPTDRQRSFIQKFYLYLNLTKPSQKLFLTWFRVNQEGKESRKSYLVESIRHIFPEFLPEQLQDSGGESLMQDQAELSQIVTPKSSRKYFAEGLKRAKKGDFSPEWMGLYQWYMGQEQWRDQILPFLEAAFYQYQGRNMGERVTRALYGSVLENSVTRLEQFSACACSHFLQYGLKLQERSLGEFAPVDMGTMFHEVLERYANAMEQEGYHWFDVPKEIQERLIDQAVEAALGSGLDSLLLGDARSTYLVERMKRILRRTVETIAEQVKTSHFSPEGYEISFSFAEDLESVNFTLSEQEKMRLRGRIDRVDTHKTEDTVYVKVVDYKSGNREFQLLSLYHGLQLQLVVYLNSAVEIFKRKYPDKNVVPGGMYYYHLDDPMIEGEAGKSDAQIREEILEELKLKGVASEAEDPSISKKTKRAGKEEFQILSGYVNHKIREIGQKIFDGEIAAKPYQLGDETGCDYCPYHGICGFDPSVPGQNYRKLENIKDDAEILRKMQEEL
ncbi:MAG: helicase-exonuclease AddAB subunit AddB [Lachnospiraceae bacterium]|nr:helicase-exonuclease AddAB subunit AddB [Lachnospiraceae bacterium]